MSADKYELSTACAENDTIDETFALQSSRLGFRRRACYRAASYEERADNSRKESSRPFVRTRVKCYHLQQQAKCNWR